MAEQSSVFRKVSLDRLSSPEQLDKKLTVISPIGWVALTSAGILILAALAWGFWGSVSNKVNGAGVLMYSGGIVNLISHTNGLVTDVGVFPGDYVERGQVVARVSQDELVRQIERYENNLAALEAVGAETLDIDIAFMNSEIYPEFAQLAGQIRAARLQYGHLENEAQKNEQDIANQRTLQAGQVKSLEEQISALETQIEQYRELLEYQREVELENAEAQDMQPRQAVGGALYTSDRGEQYRRNFRAAHQLMVMDQIGAAYIILSDNIDDASHPVFYMTRDGMEEYNPDGRFYLPNYYESVYGGDYYADIPRRSSTRTVYFDSMTGNRYIDLTGREFRPVSGNDVPSLLDQVQNRPDYDPNLAQMQSQLEGYRLQLIQARLQDAQLGSTFTSYLWGGYHQTGDQITSLMEQFSNLKQVKQQDLLRDLQELRSQLSRGSVITAGFNGTVSGLNIRRGDYVQTGGMVGTVVREDPAGSSGVVLYVPLDKGKLVSEGMEVNISPATVNREEYGYMLGRVKTVSVYAVTAEQMMSSLQNQQLVQAFGGQSAVIELEVELLRDSQTISGYRWSTPKGAPITIDPGTICSGEIKVSSRRPIDMVVPFFKRLFGGTFGEVAQ